MGGIGEGRGGGGVESWNLKKNQIPVFRSKCRRLASQVFGLDSLAAAAGPGQIQVQSILYTMLFT